MSLCAGDWGHKPSTSRAVCTEPCTASKLAHGTCAGSKKQKIGMTYIGACSKMLSGILKYILTLIMRII